MSRISMRSYTCFIRREIMRGNYLVAYCVDMNGRGRISSAFYEFNTLEEAKAHKTEVYEEHGDYVVQIYISQIV